MKFICLKYKRERERIKKDITHIIIVDIKEMYEITRTKGKHVVEIQK